MAAIVRAIQAMNGKSPAERLRRVFDVTFTGTQLENGVWFSVRAEKRWPFEQVIVTCVPLLFAFWDRLRSSPRGTPSAPVLLQQRRQDARQGPGGGEPTQALASFAAVSTRRLCRPMCALEARLAPARLSARRFAGRAALMERLGAQLCSASSAEQVPRTWPRRRCLNPQHAHKIGQASRTRTKRMKAPNWPICSSAENGESVAGSIGWVPGHVSNYLLGPATRNSAYV